MSSVRRAWKYPQLLAALALSTVASAAFAYAAWQPGTFYAAGTANPTPRGGGGGSAGNSGNGACAPAWSATNVYTGGATASAGNINYTANYWSQGANPSIHNGGAGSGEPWTPNGRCSGGGTTNPLPTHTPPTNPPPSSPPPLGSAMRF